MITIIEAISETATILRWVLRPADQSELFMVHLCVIDFGSIDSLRARYVGNRASRPLIWFILSCQGRPAARMHRQDNDLCPNIHARIKIDDIFIEHPNASTRHLLADGQGSIRSVNSVDCAADVHGTCTEGISRASRHKARKIGLALQHLCRRNPVGPFRLALDRLHTGPGETFAPDANPSP